MGWSTNCNLCSCVTDLVLGYISLFLQLLTNPNWFYCSVNECPVCHVHVAGQMSLKEDPQYDALVSAIVHKKKVIIRLKNGF